MFNKEASSEVRKFLGDFIIGNNPIFDFLNPALSNTIKEYQNQKKMNNDSKSLLDSLLFVGKNQWGISQEQILENMDKIAYHESKNDPSAVSPWGDMGMFQYGKGKKQSANIALNRLEHIIGPEGALKGHKSPSWFDDFIASNYDMSTLDPEQQKVLFMADKLRMGDAMKGVDTPDELKDFWFEHHWSGTPGILKGESKKQDITTIIKRLNSFSQSMQDYK